VFSYITIFTTKSKKNREKKERWSTDSTYITDVIPFCCLIRLLGKYFLLLDKQEGLVAAGFSLRGGLENCSCFYVKK
jgi:hypothetical protein